jgi:hypothetical protein
LALGSAKNLYFLHIFWKLLDFVGGAEPIRMELTFTASNNKRSWPGSGVSVDKRQRLSGDDSEILELEESEALIDIFDDNTEEAKEKLIGVLDQVHAERKLRNKPFTILANIGGERVEMPDGTFTFKGGFNLDPFSSTAMASTDTGLTNPCILFNIRNKIKSTIKKGPYKDQKVIFIKAPVDMTKKKLRVIYAFFVHKIYSNIQADLKHANKKPKLMALIEGFAEHVQSANLKTAARKYHLNEEQIRDSIKNDESLTIEKGMHKLQLGLGRTKNIKLAGRTVTFSWKHNNPVSEADKKTLNATNLDARHNLAFQICKYMIGEGMLASKNVIDDNGGLLVNGFVFRAHGGLFAPSFDRIKDNVNGFNCIHYHDLNNALENINIVAKMTNVRYKASKVERKKRRDDFENKSVEQRQNEFEQILDISRNVSNTPLYSHAINNWEEDKKCQAVFTNTPEEKGFIAYWHHILGLLEEQKGICSVGKYPMSLESGPWLMSVDAINPRLGHVHGNLRLVCYCNNPPDFSKLNKDLTDSTLTSQTPKIHDTYWQIV